MKWPILDTYVFAIQLLWRFHFHHPCLLRHLRHRRLQTSLTKSWYSWQRILFETNQTHCQVADDAKVSSGLATTTFVWLPSPLQKQLLRLPMTADTFSIIFYSRLSFYDTCAACASGQQLHPKKVYNNLYLQQYNGRSRFEICEGGFLSTRLRVRCRVYNRVDILWFGI